VLKALDHYEDPQRQMRDAEVMTTAIVAALHFRGNWEQARELLGGTSYIPTMLGKSRFNRRLHAISELFLTVFQALGEVFKYRKWGQVLLVSLCRKGQVSCCTHIDSI
jgi:hypothetical protein